MFRLDQKPGMGRIARIAASIALAWGCSAAALAQSGADAPSHPPTAEASPIEDSPVAQTGAKAEELKHNLAEIRLPPGFSISLYALVPGAREIAVGPQGKVVFVGALGRHVYSVVAHARSGAADEVIPFAPAIKMKMPHGVCFAPDGVLVVAEQIAFFLSPTPNGSTPIPLPRRRRSSRKAR